MADDRDQKKGLWRNLHRMEADLLDPDEVETSLYKPDELSHKLKALRAAARKKATKGAAKELADAAAKELAKTGGQLPKSKGPSSASGLPKLSASEDVAAESAGDPDTRIVAHKDMARARTRAHKRRERERARTMPAALQDSDDVSLPGPLDRSEGHSSPELNVRRVDSLLDANEIPQAAASLPPLRWLVTAVLVAIGLAVAAVLLRR